MVCQKFVRLSNEIIVEIIYKHLFVDEIFIWCYLIRRRFRHQTVFFYRQYFTTLDAGNATAMYL